MDIQVGLGPVAATQLASRARRKVTGVARIADLNPTEQRQIVDGFLAAARAGEFERLLAVLDPDVLRRAEPVS
jgi:hypothetical protein